MDYKLIVRFVIQTFLLVSIERKYKRKKLGSYPYFSVVFSITLALYVIGLFSLLLINANSLSSIVKENIQLHIYLQKEVTTSQKDSLQTLLSQAAFTAKKNGTPQISFVSKEEAAKKFIKETGEDFHEFLGENPLRDAFTLGIAADYASNAKLKLLQTQLQTNKSIYEVDYKENMVDDINKNIHLISLILISFTVILLIAVLFLINNTIKLALFSQRFLIRSMQLVGATGFFIQKPFIFRSSLHGFIGGLLAAILLASTLQYAHSTLPELVVLHDASPVFALFGIMILVGIFISLLSTIFSMRRYLRMQLDDLY